MKHQRDEYQHYNIRKQSIGHPANGTLRWVYKWQVRRPCNHPDMRGDNWEKVGYKMFDTHPEAIRWGSREATKDRLRLAIEQATEHAIEMMVETLWT